MCNKIEDICPDCEESFDINGLCACMDEDDICMECGEDLDFCFCDQEWDFEDDPYCSECGGDELAYIDKYANGEKYKCQQCDNQFIWRSMRCGE